jgi:hypothetical protein
LLVHTGLLRCELTPFSAEHVESVDVRRRRVVLGPPAAIRRFP